MSSTSKNVIVLGAGGRTGHRIVQETLRRGHRVTAAVRSPAKFPVLGVHANHAADFRVARADVRDPESLQLAIEAQDVVVSAIGPPSRNALQLYSEGARATVAAMEHCGVDRFIGITSAGVRYDDPNLAWWYRRLVRPLLKELYTDMILMEQIVRASSLDWTLVRPVLLVDRDPTGTYRVLDNATPERGRTITRADVAQFIVRELDEQRWSRRAPTLAH